MKKLTLAVVLLSAISAQAYAATTTSGYIACSTKEWFGDYRRFLVEKDDGSIRAYISSRKCFYLSSGMTVTVLESPGVFGGTVGFAADGIKAWSFREALKY